MMKAFPSIDGARKPRNILPALTAMPSMFAPFSAEPLLRERSDLLGIPDHIAQPVGPDDVLGGFVAGEWKLGLAGLFVHLEAVDEEAGWVDRLASFSRRAVRADHIEEAAVVGDAFRVELVEFEFTLLVRHEADQLARHELVALAREELGVLLLVVDGEADGRRRRRACRAADRLARLLILCKGRADTPGRSGRLQRLRPLLLRRRGCRADQAGDECGNETAGQADGIRVQVPVHNRPLLRVDHAI